MRIATLLRRFTTDDAGLSALEFGLLLPTMVLAFLGIMETVSLYSMKNRVNWAAEVMADNIARYGNADAATLKASELRSMGTGARNILAQSDYRSNSADADLYVGAMMMVRNTANTAVVCQSSWSSTCNASTSSRELAHAFKGSSYAQGTTQILTSSELATKFTDAWSLTDTSCGTIYVIVRYKYKSMFDIFFDQMTLESSAYSKQRFGANVSYDKNN